MVSLVEPTGNAMRNKYGEELIRTARALCAKNRGILAADESTGTIGKRVRHLFCWKTVHLSTYVGKTLDKNNSKWILSVV
jgi:hypothetical protein